MLEATIEVHEATIKSQADRLKQHEITDNERNIKDTERKRLNDEQVKDRKKKDRFKYGLSCAVTAANLGGGVGKLLLGASTGQVVLIVLEMVIVTFYLLIQTYVLYYSPVEVPYYSYSKLPLSVGSKEWDTWGLSQAALGLSQAVLGAGSAGASR